MKRTNKLVNVFDAGRGALKKMADTVVDSLQKASLRDFQELLTPAERSAFTPVLVVVVQRELQKAANGLAAELTGARVSRPSVRLLAKLEQPAQPAQPAPRKLRMSTARKTQLKLQGRYIGLLRGIKDAKLVARAKAVAAKNGMGAAIKFVLANRAKKG